ncbi:hypothetical protein OG21DRAFT_1607669 [Imleria badia]|nr:hypothetical protein OG21DRAFT_1607669 [Imleria badia]
MPRALQLSIIFGKAGLTLASDEARVKIPPSSLKWLVINRFPSRIQEFTSGTEYLSLHSLRCTGLVLPNLMVFR